MIPINQNKIQDSFVESHFKNTTLKGFNKSSELSSNTDFLAVFQQSLSGINPVQNTEAPIENNKDTAYSPYSQDKNIQAAAEKSARAEDIYNYKDQNSTDKRTSDKDEKKVSENIKSGKSDKKEKSENIKENKSPSLHDLKNKDNHHEKETSIVKPSQSNGKDILAELKKSIKNATLKNHKTADLKNKNLEENNNRISENIKPVEKDSKFLTINNRIHNKIHSQKEHETIKTDHEKKSFISEKKSALKKDHHIQASNIDNQKNIENNVSRETIVSQKDLNKSQDSINTKAIHVKSESTDKSLNIMSGLKSEMNSDMNSNQNHSGFSMHSAEKMFSAQRTEDSPLIRQNLQQQIDQFLQRARVIVKDSGNAQLSTKLNPKELGEISIKLVLSNGILKGRLTVENDHVQKELNDKLAVLINDLKNDGYQVDGFQIDVKSDGANHNQNNDRFLNAVAQEFNSNFFSNSRSNNSYDELENIPAGENIYA